LIIILRTLGERGETGMKPFANILSVIHQSPMNLIARNPPHGSTLAKRSGKVAIALFTAVLLAGADAAHAAELEPIRISEDGGYFVMKDSGTRFTPWGFNYLGESERLIEEYWEKDWEGIAEDFREMKQLGANVVRIHLQLSTYLSASDQARPEELARLRKLLDLAQEHGLYLDLTGLGLYRLAKVPVWLDALSEKDRWAAQARFWPDQRAGDHHTEGGRASMADGRTRWLSFRPTHRQPTRRAHAGADRRRVGGADDQGDPRGG
jgi:hypothetical protein